MESRRERLKSAYYENKISGIEFLIDNVWDPHNVAALSRSADALGISKINLYYTYNEFPTFGRTGHRSSGSATRWLEYERVENLSEFVKYRKADGYQLFGAAKAESSKAITSLNFKGKYIIAMGNEHKGLSPELRDVCDELIHVPMIGVVESYNISVAASLIMYEIFRQRQDEVDDQIIDSLRGVRG